MATFTDKLAHHWRDAASLILGIWLAVSPWVLSYGAENAATCNACVSGIAIAAVTAAAIMAYRKWEKWLNAILSAWLIVSPFLLGYMWLDSALWNQMVVGVLVGILSLSTAVVEPGQGGMAARG
jgi:hypothetical protein